MTTSKGKRQIIISGIKFLYVNAFHGPLKQIQMKRQDMARVNSIIDQNIHRPL